MQPANFILVATLSLFLTTCHTTEIENNIPPLPAKVFGTGSKEKPAARSAYENRKLVDPKTNQIPADIHKKELEYSQSIKNDGYANKRTKALDWALTGPHNVGGRTRALAVDIRDDDVLLAGGVSGGIWRSEDAGFTWTRTTQPDIINSVTHLVQDTRLGKRDIWYFGTGELRGNSARAAGAVYRGDGIFKSTDGGKSWDVLPGTQTKQPATFDNPFDYTWNLATNPAADFEKDEVYAATYGNILRSRDGGTNWEHVLGEPNLLEKSGDFNDSNASFYTNIMITPSGKYYAYLSTFAPGEKVNTNFVNKGIFYSDDGETWTNITPFGFVNFSERLVMAYAPSNENILYFLVEGTFTQLWKLQNGVWSNRSDQIPDENSDFEAYDSQSSYNMTIKVHPNDPEIVFIGGTNLYRSSDGFATSFNTAQIGGYDLEDINDPYPNHHPDQHETVFLSESDQMLTANDGGIFKTNNSTASTVTWIPLNNGYITSQFYAVALAKSEGDARIIGGLQDNGTYLKFDNLPNSSWESILGGDGGYCASTADDLYWYASFQEAGIFKLKFDEKDELDTWAKVDPSGIARDNYLFITPFVLDPNNFNRMYLAGDSAIWRNDNLAQINLYKQVTTSTNWKVIDPVSPVQDITALDISTNPGHTLFYGTADGNVYKITDANLANPQTTLIFSQDGYVSNICIDPADANHLLVCYSNYNISSLFLSTDGGNSFVDMGGNLEENPDGSGNGPSIRWAEIVALNDDNYMYFVGTSVGLYSTEQADGQETVWKHEGVESIGNSVVSMLDFRSSDGKIVAATHGNGVFESSLSGTSKVEIQQDNPELTLLSGYPNPFKESFKIHFTVPELGLLSIQITDIAGKQIRTIFNDAQFEGDVIASWDGLNDSGSPVQNGIYNYIILYQGKNYGGKVILNR